LLRVFFAWEILTSDVGPEPALLDPHRELPYPDQEREGRLQSAERAVPTFINSSKATNLLSA
jgi:hypothetical protein